MSRAGSSYEWLIIIVANEKFNVQPSSASLGAAYWTRIEEKVKQQTIIQRVVSAWRGLANTRGRNEILGTIDSLLHLSVQASESAKGCMNPPSPLHQKNSNIAAICQIVRHPARSIVQQVRVNLWYLRQLSFSPFCGRVKSRAIGLHSLGIGRLLLLLSRTSFGTDGWPAFLIEFGFLSLMVSLRTTLHEEVTP